MTLSARRLPPLFGAAVLAMSCQLVFGLDEYGPSDTAAGGDGGAGGGTGVGGGGLGDGVGGGGVGGQAGCVCAPVAPIGWEGPFYGYEIPAASMPTKCPDQTPVLHRLPYGPPEATCSDCTCDSAQPCLPPTVTCYASGSCSTSLNTYSNDFNGGECEHLTGLSCKMASAPALGACTPGGGQLSTTDWKGALAVCGAEIQQGSCGGSDVCLQAPDAGALLCVSAQGAAACPAGWSHAFTGYESPGPDNRACACSCGPLQGVNCGDAFRLYDIPGCPSEAITPVVNMCYGQSFVGGSGRFQQPSGGACVPSQPAVVGDFDLGQATTVCCRDAGPP